MKSAPEDFDVVENFAQFGRAVVLAALVGTAEILRSIRKRV